MAAYCVGTQRLMPVGKQAGKRRGLGPGGRNGTIEVLCRGSVKIATVEIPHCGGIEKLKFICCWSHRHCLNSLLQLHLGECEAGIKRAAEGRLEVRKSVNKMLVWYLGLRVRGLPRLLYPVHWACSSYALT